MNGESAAFFWFDSSAISDAGHSFYGRYVYEHFLSLLAPSVRNNSLQWAVFFDGDCMTALADSPILDYFRAEDRALLTRVSAIGENLCYLIALFGENARDWAELDRDLLSAEITGYLGMTRPRQFSRETFLVVTKYFSLCLSLRIDGPVLKRIDFAFLGDDALQQMGFVTGAGPQPPVGLPPEPEPEPEPAPEPAPTLAPAPAPAPPAASSHSRQIRVFVSSTFRDMRAERDELAKHVFPKIRKLCFDRHVTFTDVDLRWGITDEQTAAGQVLPICLDEIRRCRPYFISLLGERYGWVPKVAGPILETQTWLRLHERKSYTELEILYGVLNDPGMAQHAYFYFRDPAYIQLLPASADRADYFPENPTAAYNLHQLKERIRDHASTLSPAQSASFNTAPDPVHPRYPLRENYRDPRQLAEWVERDLTDLVNRLYPADETITPLDQEILDQQMHAESFAAVYIRRPEYFRRLDEHAAGDGPPLLVLGESGAGKSALLANWTLDFEARNPDKHVILHFVGATPQSSYWALLLKRLMMEIKQRFQLTGEIPAELEKLREMFPVFLQRAADKGKLVLVLDGLNQLDDRDRALELTWLPRMLPPNIRLIASTLPGPVLEAARHRGWNELTVGLLETAERRELIVEYLARFAHALNQEQLNLLAQAPGAANPLFIRSVLDELRLFGIHEHLPGEIAGYLECTGVSSLFSRILRRWESDYERDRPGLVRDALTRLYAARRGLTEFELRELLGADGAPLPQAVWSALRLAASSAVLERSGLFVFAHEYLREAVRQRYLASPQEERNTRTFLAGYFAKQEFSSRMAEELPWQFQQAELWPQLKECLTRDEMFAWLYAQAKYELMDYWLHLEHAGYSRGDAYLNMCLNQNGRLLTSPSILASCGSFLYESSFYKQAEPLMRLALVIDEQRLGENHPDVSMQMSNLAQLLSATNRLDEAEGLMKQALLIDEKKFGKEHRNVAIRLSNLGELLRATNRIVEAEPLVRRAMAIDEKLYGRDSPEFAIRLNSLSILLEATNRTAEAEKLLRQALTIDEQHLGSNHPNVAIRLDNLGVLLLETDRPEEAEPLLRRALAINRQYFGDESANITASLNNLAGLLGKTGRAQEAEALIQKALAIDEDSLGPDHPRVAVRLTNLADLLQMTGNVDEAERLMRRVLSIDENSYGPEHPKTGTDLNNLGILLCESNRLREAEPMLRRNLEILLKFSHVNGSNHLHLGDAANAYGEVLLRMGHSKEQIVAKLNQIGRPYGKHWPGN